MNFDRGGQNLPTQRSRAFFLGQGLEEELNGFANIRESLLDRISVRLAALQFRAPGVASVLVLLNYNADLARQ